jgi:hypothetical protein
MAAITTNGSAGAAAAASSLPAVADPKKTAAPATLTQKDVHNALFNQGIGGKDGATGVGGLRGKTYALITETNKLTYAAYALLPFAAIADVLAYVFVDSVSYVFEKLYHNLYKGQHTISNLNAVVSAAVANADLSSASENEETKTFESLATVSEHAMTQAINVAKTTPGFNAENPDHLNFVKEALLTQALVIKTGYFSKETVNNNRLVTTWAAEAVTQAFVDHYTLILQKDVVKTLVGEGKLNKAADAMSALASFGVDVNGKPIVRAFVPEYYDNLTGMYTKYDGSSKQVRAYMGDIARHLEAQVIKNRAKLEERFGQLNKMLDGNTPEDRAAFEAAVATKTAGFVAQKTANEAALADAQKQLAALLTKDLPKAEAAYAQAFINHAKAEREQTTAWIALKDLLSEATTQKVLAAAYSNEKPEGLTEEQNKAFADWAPKFRTAQTAQKDLKAATEALNKVKTDVYALAGQEVVRLAGGKGRYDAYLYVGNEGVHQADKPDAYTVTVKGSDGKDASVFVMNGHGATPALSKLPTIIELEAAIAASGDKDAAVSMVRAELRKELSELSQAIRQSNGDVNVDDDAAPAADRSYDAKASHASEPDTQGLGQQLPVSHRSVPMGSTSASSTVTAEMASAVSGDSAMSAMASANPATVSASLAPAPSPMDSWTMNRFADSSSK